MLPAVESRVFLQLLVLLDIIEYVTEIKIKAGDRSVLYCAVIFDQKAISTGVVFI